MNDEDDFWIIWDTNLWLKSEDELSEKEDDDFEMTLEEAAAVEQMFGISWKYWHSLEEGRRIQSRTTDNYIRMFSFSESPVIFQLEWNTHDLSREYFFQAPEGASFEVFKTLCNRLMVEAANDIADGKPPKSVLYEGGMPWIGFDSLIEEVAARLPEHGYVKVDFPTVEFKHGMIIRIPEDDQEKVFDIATLQKIVAHNKKTEEGLDDYRAKLREEVGQGAGAAGLETPEGGSPGS